MVHCLPRKGIVLAEPLVDDRLSKGTDEDRVSPYPRHVGLRDSVGQRHISREHSYHVGRFHADDLKRVQVNVKRVKV